MEEQTDEDKMIKKLEEHRDAISLIIEIGELYDIPVERTFSNNSNGDFTFNIRDKNNLIEVIDKYLNKNKI